MQFVNYQNQKPIKVMNLRIRIQ
uniref:Uncharacterized protein n=1 Tax=Rhizophora mucronata TaxID=61149 RepID=A0A2P2JPW9_RHIMU